MPYEGVEVTVAVPPDTLPALIVRVEGLIVRSLLKTSRKIGAKQLTEVV